MAGPRTVILTRIYLTLVSVSLLLIAVHVYRHFPVVFAPRDPLTRTIRMQPSMTTAVGPSINWGGQRR